MIKKTPIRGIEPRAAAFESCDLKGGNVSRYTISDSRSQRDAELWTGEKDFLHASRSSCVHLSQRSGEFAPELMSIGGKVRKCVLLGSQIVTTEAVMVDGGRWITKEQPALRTLDS
jgi:hypothetical protein